MPTRVLIVTMLTSLALLSAPLGATTARSAAAPPTAAGAASAPVADVVVRSGRTTVVIERRPFALEVRDGDGRVVLRTTRVRDPLGLGVDVEPEPGGGSTVPARARYAPLTYEVGGSASASYPAGPWAGNLVTGASAGLQYAATSVTGVRRSGERVTLTLATDDPTGRRVLLTVAPQGTSRVAISVRVDRPGGVNAVALAFASGRDEAFHGFGGRHNAVDQAGQTLVQYTQEENQSAGPLQPVAGSLPGTGGDHYLFPNGPTAAYYVQNSFVSSRGYGLLLDRTELAQFRLGSDRPGQWQVANAAAGTDLVVTAGSAQQNVSALTSLTGRHRLPPAWATGLTLTRAVRVLSAQSDTPESYEAKVRADLREIDRQAARGTLDVAVYGLEGWGVLSRAVTRDLIGELRRRGIRVLLYIRAYVSADNANTESPSVFATALRRGYLTRTALGAPYIFGSTFGGGVAGLIDFTRPSAVAWWKQRVRGMLNLGADGFMQDFGEQTQPDMVFADGRTGATMHNQYATIYHRTSRRVLDAYARTHPKRRCCFMYTRTGFTGSPGAAAYENGNFPGDETTDWSASSGLPSIVPDMLNRSIGGLYGFTTDIGGYLDNLTGSPSAELYTRWAQASALTPFFRVHNSASTGVRMPWSYGAATQRRFAAAARLHNRFEAYIRQAWSRARRTGVPVVRPMWLAAPEASGARRDLSQWLLGNDVLVAPVLEQGARRRGVSLPRGCWRREGTGPRVVGPKRITVDAPLDRLPWFRRC